MLTMLLDVRAELKSPRYIKNARNYNYDAYVVIDSKNNNIKTKMTEAKKDKQYSFDKPEIYKMIANVETIRGSQFTPDKENAYVCANSHIESSRRRILTHKYTFSRVATKELLNTWFPDDAEYIYKHIDGMPIHAQGDEYEDNLWWTAPKWNLLYVFL